MNNSGISPAVSLPRVRCFILARHTLRRPTPHASPSRATRFAAPREDTEGYTAVPSNPFSCQLTNPKGKKRRVSMQKPISTWPIG